MPFRLFLGFLVLAMGAIAANQCSAAGATALAMPADIATDGVYIYSAVNFDTVAEAKESAMAGCRRGANSTIRSLCKIVATFSNQCVAQALDPQNGTPGFGWALAEDSVSAKRQAIDNCRDTAGASRRNACIVNDRSLWCDGRAK